MDGQQSVVIHSIQKDLRRWIIVLCICFSVVAGSISGFTAFNEARSLQDRQLEKVGQLVRQIDDASVPRVVQSHQASDEDTEERIFIQRLSDKQSSVLAIPNDLVDGFHTLTIESLEWRVLLLTKDNSQRYVIAQDHKFNHEFALSNTLSTILPLLVLAPLLILMVNFIISYSFRPMSELAARVSQRKETDLTPLAHSGSPLEASPFIDAINQLLSRAGQMLIQQRRFTADAAHELRTPLTALSLLVDNVGQATDMQTVQQRMIPLQESIMRMRTLINQLLSLARMQGKTEQQPKKTVAFAPIVQQAIIDLHPLAEAKQIDLGMGQNEQVYLDDQADSLSLLVRNALDNAIRYTPKGGRIDVDLCADGVNAVLCVRDSGPGIPAAELDKVFEPFHRAQGMQEPGNGLGLTISREAAQQLDGEIRLRNRPEGGLEFCYRQLLFIK